MKIKLTLPILAVIVMAGCKPKVYTDQYGRHYTLSDSCIYGHSYQYMTYIHIGKTTIPQWRTGWKCDSSITAINYLDK